MASTSSISSLTRHQLSSISTRATSASSFSLRSLSTVSSAQRNSHLHKLLRSTSKSPSIELLSPWFQQYRTFIAKLTRKSQATAHATSPKSSGRVEISPSAKLDPPLQLTNLPYFVRRTPSHQLPVYLVTKSGGTKKQTSIRKTEGDLDALRDDLARYLGVESGDGQGPKSPEVDINRRTGHIIIKGWRKDEVQNFLLERNF